jgi:histidine phosphotransferase ChpT
MRGPGEISGAALARFLCSRLCHDLVSPAGAVNAGLELYEEDPANGGDALSLVHRSAQQLTRRLAFYRLAFGMGGEAGDRMSTRGVRQVAADLFKDSSVRLDWPEEPGEPPHIGLLAGKLVLNLILAGFDCLPRGGTLTVRLVTIDSGLGVAVQAAGLGARPSEDLTTALDGPAGDQITARNVLGVLIRTLASEIGAEVERDPAGEGEVRVAAVMPQSG